MRFLQITNAYCVLSNSKHSVLEMYMEIGLKSFLIISVPIRVNIANTNVKRILVMCVSIASYTSPSS